MIEVEARLESEVVKSFENHSEIEVTVRTPMSIRLLILLCTESFWRRVKSELRERSQVILREQE